MLYIYTYNLYIYIYRERERDVIAALRKPGQKSEWFSFGRTMTGFSRIAFSSPRRAAMARYCRHHTAVFPGRAAPVVYMFAVCLLVLLLCLCFCLEMYI